MANHKRPIDSYADKTPMAAKTKHNCPPGECERELLLLLLSAGQN
jgi:hypothetical protein